MIAREADLKSSGRSFEQIVTPRPKSSGRRGGKERWLWRYVTPQQLRLILRISAVTAALISALVLYRPIVRSSVFELHEVRISGTKRLTVAETETMVREVAPKSLLDIDLEKLRADLRRKPIIREVEIARVLPDGLRLQITERQPVAVVAQSGHTPVCVDADGVVIGDFHLMGDEQAPPLLGWNDSHTPVGNQENQARLALYRQVQRELISGNYWTQIDQVDLRDSQDVTVSLSQSPGTWIHLGDREFMNRFELSLQILEAIRQHNAKQLLALGVSPSDEMFDSPLRISYIDVSQPSKAVIRIPTLKRASTSGSRPASRPYARRRGR